MPLYEYQCSACHFRFERRQRFDDEPVSICPRCQGKVWRVLHSVPIFFKGSGFYSTDQGKGWQGASSRGKGKKPSKKEGVDEGTTAKSE